MRTIAAGVLPLWLAAGGTSAQSWEVRSPDGQTAVTVEAGARADAHARPLLPGRG
jgi:hypothetical protein